MREPVIRALEPHEWRLLRELRIRALADAPDAFSPTAADARGRDDAYWKKGLRALQGPSRVLAALAGDRAVGLVSATVDAGGVGHVGAMWVDPGARGTGLGRRLLEAALSALDGQGCPRIELSVTEGNRAALRLYESEGFRLSGGSEPLREGSPLRNLFMVREARAPTGGSA